MPAENATLTDGDLVLDGHQRGDQAFQAAPGQSRKPCLVGIGNHRQKCLHPHPAERRDNAEFRQVGADRVDQHGALADQERAAAM